MSIYLTSRKYAIAQIFQLFLFFSLTFQEKSASIFPDGGNYYMYENEHWVKYFGIFRQLEDRQENELSSNV